MIKVNVKEYSFFKKEFYEEIKLYPIINSVISGLQKGYVYTNEERQILIVISKSGFTLISFKHSGLNQEEKIFNFFYNCKEIPNYLHIYNPIKFILNYVKENYTQYKLRERIQYIYNKKNCVFDKTKLPLGYKIKVIQDISKDKLNALELNLFSRYWDSRESFFNHSIGVCIIDEKENIAAICYSAAHIDQVAEMDTLVLENYRGKGLMRLVSEPFFNLASSVKSDVHWDTFIENKPSFILGEKFKPNFKNRYTLMSVFFNK